MKNSTFHSFVVSIASFVWILVFTNMAISQNIEPPKTGWLIGVVKEKLYGKPVSNVRIETGRRIIDIERDGTLNMRSHNEIDSINISSTTNENGEYRIQVPLVGNDFFIIKYSKPGYEDLVYSLTEASIFSDPSVNEIYIYKKTYTKIEINELNEILLNEKEINELSKESFQEALEDTTGETIRSINCTYSSIPAQVYVSHLVEQYNNPSCNNSNGYTGNINFVDYIEGVIKWEYYNAWPSSSELEGLKAQAVAARTYSLKRVTLGLPANCGQSYTSVTNSTCHSAAQTTSQNVLLYNSTSLKSVAYFAQCNGDVTQNSEEGKWGLSSGCSTSCSVCGNTEAWHRTKACSGHASPSVCLSFIPSAQVNRKIRGHGVGLCQWGAHYFNLAGFKFDNILSEFYTNMCIANYNYQAPSNDNSCTPTTLSVATSCSNTLAHNFNATTTTGIPNPTCGFSSTTSKDVWFRFTVPSSGQYRIETYKGSITDAAMATYIGGCSSLTQVACNDTYNGNTMPTIAGTSTPGLWIYVRVWGKSGAIGTFSICVKNSLNAFQENLNDETNIYLSQGEINVFPNPIYPGQTLYLTGIQDGSEIALLDPLQKSHISQIISGEGLVEFDISNAISGIYFLQIRKKGLPTTYKEILIQ